MSEQAKVEQIITEFYAKGLHIILESRSIYDGSSHNLDLSVSSPSSSSSSSSVRPRDKWFNLALKDCPSGLESLDPWRGGNLEPLVVDVILSRRPHLPGDGFPWRGKPVKVIERWVIQHESRNSGGPCRKMYKKLIILLRSLYSMVRLLPAYKLCRDLNSSGRINPYSLSHRISSFAEPFTRREDSELRQFVFVPVETPNGKLCLSVSYVPTLMDVNSEPSTPIEAQFIADYVGSPTTDPLKRFHFLPARRHSWSSDLNRAAAPSHSPLPSPTNSEPRAPPWVNCPHQPPQIVLNTKESLAHKKTMSLDECWPSLPFSVSPSPSPPRHVPASSLSKALLRSGSAPVAIPLARFVARSSGLPHHDLPPTPSPKTNSMRTMVALSSAPQSSPSEGKHRARPDQLRLGEFHTGVALHKVFSFGKDDIGYFSGSPRMSISRSSSRLSFLDDIDNELVCPFAVDDDDLVGPHNRTDTSDAKALVSVTSETGPIRKSQEAAVGSLIHTLKAAPPLRQACCSSPTKPSEAPEENSQGLLKLRTAADALEELEGYREIKDLLLSQSGSPQAYEVKSVARNPSGS
ncbi:hypothetical protein QJS10_CPA08g01332 [Acorus calamus]|uniref:Autophagy-related protein 13 N-terminal domain-containing protein n=1 Tax=Acorus calamus TaxID=4465 RepID=A0AAV9EEE3_ACOCL|nr:hypothetical protein QJS10_CPA08g01332 [Acorus calamus]